MSRCQRTTASAFAFVFAFVFALGLLAAPVAHAQQDPWAARVRATSDTPLATFQGVDCVSIRAPRPIVWRLLVGPEYASTWFFAGLSGASPRPAHYKKGPTAEKGDTLILEASTEQGLRHIDLAVIASSPPELLSFMVRADDANLLDRNVERLSITLLLEDVGDHTTDVSLAMHYDPDSPFSAILSPASVHRQRERRQAALAALRALAEEAARLAYPPLHEVPLLPPAPVVYKTLPPRK